MSDKTASFAELFAQGAIPVEKPVSYRLGDRVVGAVAHISKDTILVDLDGKQQGYFELDGTFSEPPVLGEKLEGYVVGVELGSIKLAKRMGKESGATGSEAYQAAYEQGVPVDGSVTGVVKGGLQVMLGSLRAFCPASQIDTQYVTDLDQYIGKTFAFIITKLEAKNAVLSRKALLERENRVKADKLMETLVVGANVKGRVTRVEGFGCFVDIGGIEGLIPTRELSYERRAAGEVVSVGDSVEVQIKAIGQKGNKTEITLSLKALSKDPWDAIDTIAPVGRVVAGQVTRLAEFGAFVRLGEGIEGLLHISELAAKGGKTEEAVAIGDQLLLRVVAADAKERRIKLALASEGRTVGSEDRGDNVTLGQIVKTIIEKVENYGLVTQMVGFKGRAARGVIPNSETGTRPGADLRREFAPGTEVTTKVIEAGNRIRLSIKQAKDDAERADYDRYKQETKGLGMGTFGDILSQKLKK